MRKVILLIIALFPVLCLAHTIEVCPDCECTTITEAIDFAAPNDHILVLGGHYFEGNIIVDKPLHLEGRNWPILDGENETEILTLAADSIRVEGFQIQNVGTSYIEDRAGLRVRRSDHFEIHNNRLLNTFFGIYLEKANYGTITNNEVLGNATEESSSGNAIHLWHCKRIKVTGNKVDQHRDGIYFEFVDESLVQGNHCENNLRYGLHFMFSNDDEYLENTFRRNGAGVAVMFSKKIKIYQNVFEENWGKASYGLLLKEIYDTELKHNVFRNNTLGILVEGSTRIIYSNNDFLQNGWAIKMNGGCLDNNIQNNNFIGNTFELSLQSSINNNKLDGNYWSQYAGYDLDHNGIGDIPHRPVKLFNFVVNQTPEAMVLLRSLFIDLLNFSEKVSPILTPENVVDASPKLIPITHTYTNDPSK